MAVSHRHSTDAVIEKVFDPRQNVLDRTIGAVRGASPAPYEELDVCSLSDILHGSN
jgi:hypothetical protein